MTNKLVVIINSPKVPKINNILLYEMLFCGPGSSVVIATDYRPDGSGLNTAGDEVFRPSRPTLGQPSLLYNRYRVFPGGKVRPGRAADHSPPSTAARHGRVELYLYPPSGPHRACNGITLTFYLLLSIFYAHQQRKAKIFQASATT